MEGLPPPPDKPKNARDFRSVWRGWRSAPMEQLMPETHMAKLSLAVRYQTNQEVKVMKVM